jgi:hypothetical protein
MEISKGMKNFCLTTIFIFFAFYNLSAQSGAWISQTLQASMSGSNLTNRGETVVAYTREYSQYIYFFDINSGQWSEVDLGSSQHYQDMLVTGQTAFAYSDSLLVGYSAIISQWDTVRYEGNLISPDGISVTKGYGCSESLAYFFTDLKVYIFDSELGSWQIYSHSFPGNYTYGWFWASDDYAAGIFHRNYPEKAKNIVYSQHRHSFNELDQGGSYYYPDWPMNHGYVARWSAGVDNLFVGYSSITNKFSMVAPHSGTFITDGYIEYINIDQLGEITCMSWSYREYIDPTQWIAHYYGYDTRNGTWMSDSFTYDPLDWGHTSTWNCGGLLTGAFRTFWSTAENTYLIYNGLTGNLEYHTPGIHRLGGVYGTARAGGKVVMAGGINNLWFYNIATGASFTIDGGDGNWTHYFVAENYCSFSRYQAASDTMTLYFFSGEVDNWSSIQTHKQLSNSYVGTANVYAFNIVGPNKVVVFYSPKLHLIHKQNTTIPFGSIYIKGVLAAYSGSNESYLFDANTGSIHHNNFAVDYTGLGDSVCVCREGEYTIHAYSSITGQWNHTTLPEMHYGVISGSCISLISTIGYNKFYAFNGYNGNLVELIPEGSGLVYMVGGKTAIVVRDTKIYAFDPQQVTNISPNRIQPVQFYLAQNYPNPFNPTTTIKYQIPELSFVTLKVYDVLGKEITTLVKEDKPAGTNKIEFNGIILPSGVYFYRLQAGDYIVTKKMVLLR